MRRAYSNMEHYLPDYAAESPLCQFIISGEPIAGERFIVSLADLAKPAEPARRPKRKRKKL